MENLHGIIGARIKQLREKAMMSQSDIAKIRNVTQSTVAKQESGARALGEDGLLWYAEKFGVTTDYLLGRTDIPNVYSHPITLPDGREGVYLDTQKDLPPQEREQVIRATQSALDCEKSVDNDVIKLEGSNLDESALEQLVARIVARELDKRDGRSNRS